MTSTKIEGGCVLVSKATAQAPASYLYRYNTKEGEVILVFTASLAPKIGDTIENGVLVDAVLPQSNQDKSKWTEQSEATWPKNR